MSLKRQQERERESARMRGKETERVCRRTGGRIERDETGMKKKGTVEFGWNPPACPVGAREREGGICARFP